MTEPPRVDHVPGQLSLPLLRLRLLSLFSGYGGLDLAVAPLLDADVIAHAEVEPGACRVLAHRFPGVPNVGDVTAIDWSSLGPVDVITGGFPCQDVSLAGRRLGITHDTRSGLWAHMAAAVDELRPGLVIIENVRGLLSARANHPAHSDVEPCPWCMGRPDELSLRALGAVLGDLSDIGYDAAWRLLSAADVGAPHGRARVFVVAWPADPAGGREQVEPSGDDGGTAVGGAEPRAVDRARGGDPAAGVPVMGRGAGSVPDDAADPDDVGRHGRARHVGPPAGGGQPADGGDTAADPVNGGRQRRAPDEVGGSFGRVAAAGGGADAGPGSADADAAGDGRHERQPESARLVGGSDAAERGATAAADRWGPYAAAVGRWEAVLGRAAPAPTEPGRTAERLSPRFVEWMMGLPDGWVTDVPGITRNDALRLLGNGVVPRQAQAAVASLLRTVADMAAPPSDVDEGAA